MPRLPAALCAAVLLAGAPALSATLDFTGLAPGNLGGSISVGGVTIEGQGSLLNLSDTYFTETGGAICAQQGTRANCRGNLTIRFDGKVRKVSLSSAGYQAGDVATIQVYRGGNLLGTTGVASNGRISLAIFKKITRIRIEYEGVEDGIAFGRVNFTPLATARQGLAAARAYRPAPSPASPSPVPVPAGLGLMAGALGLLGALRLRRARRDD
jgi:hypothetical protein